MAIARASTRVPVVHVRTHVVHTVLHTVEFFGLSLIRTRVVHIHIQYIHTYNVHTMVHTYIHTYIHTRTMVRTMVLPTSMVLPVVHTYSILYRVDLPVLQYRYRTSLAIHVFVLQYDKYEYIAILAMCTCSLVVHLESSARAHATCSNCALNSAERLRSQTWRGKRTDRLCCLYNTYIEQ